MSEGLKLMTLCTRCGEPAAFDIANGVGGGHISQAVSGIDFRYIDIMGNAKADMFDDQPYPLCERCFDELYDWLFGKGDGNERRA